MRQKKCKVLGVLKKLFGRVGSACVGSSCGAGAHNCSTRA